MDISFELRQSARLIASFMAPVPVTQSLIIIWKGLAWVYYLVYMFLCGNRTSLTATLCPQAHWHNFRKTAEMQAKEMRFIFIRGYLLDIHDCRTKRRRPSNVNGWNCFRFLINATDTNDNRYYLKNQKSSSSYEINH